MRTLLPIALLFALAFACTSAKAPAGPALDPAALHALEEKAAALDSDALVVLHEGQPALERWFHGEPRAIEAQSVTKSVVSMAIGRLLTTGALASLDVPASTFFPAWKEGGRRAITLRHLVSMTSGLEVVPLGPSVLASASSPLVAEPGTRFAYDNSAANLLSVVVERVSGRPLERYVAEEIFAPLGITGWSWGKDAAGIATASGGLQIRPADLAKLGQLMLDGGRWQGKRLLSAAWVREATSPGQASRDYGQLWWMLASTSGDSAEAPAGFHATPTAGRGSN